MDELDKKLFEDLSGKEQAPIRYEYVIRNALNEKRSSKKIFKVAFTTCMVFVLSTGGVIAGQKIYEKVFKEPVKLNSFYTAEGERVPVTEEEKVGAITEEQAKQKAYEILKEFGYELENIVSVELINRPNDYDLIYKLKTDKNSTIEVDGKNTDRYKLFISNKDEEIKNYRGEQEELEKEVREFCAEHKIDLTGYELTNINTNGANLKDSYVWYFYFYKKYGNIINPHEEVSIGIVPEINKVCWIIVNKNHFDNNEIVITEEEAKQIVLDTEKNIPTGMEIKNLYTDLEIVKMNGYAYTRTNDYERYYKQTHTEGYPIEDIVYHRTEGLIRKAWMVTVEYDISEGKRNQTDRFFTYYVDVTTGEIIGGTEIYYTTKYSGNVVVAY